MQIDLTESEKLAIKYFWRIVRVTVLLLIGFGLCYLVFHGVANYRNAMNSHNGLELEVAGLKSAKTKLENDLRSCNDSLFNATNPTPRPRFNN